MPRPSLLYLKAYKCHQDDCGFIFSCEWNQTQRPCCPKCSDNAEVRRHPKQTRRKPKSKRPRWTPHQTETLLKLKGTMTYAQIGQIIGKNEDNVYQKLREMRLKNESSADRNNA